MKKIMISFLLVVATVMNANAMSKYRASREARFLTDKMAWELDLTPSQIEDVYEINYDYFRSLVDVNYVYTREYEIRNEELSFVLSPWQWNRYILISYFYTPVRVLSYSWFFPIYDYYRHDRFFYDAPYAYSHYRGGYAYNREHYRARIEIHHPGGTFRPEPSHHRKPIKEDRPMGQSNRNRRNENVNNGNNNGSVNHGGNNHGNGNVKPSNNNNNNNRGENTTPSRNTPNRSASASRGSNNSTRSNNNSNSSTRPTRSQQNSKSRSNTSGRR